MLFWTHLTVVTAAIQIEAMRNRAIDWPRSKTPSRITSVSIIELQYLSSIQDGLKFEFRFNEVIHMKCTYKTIMYKSSFSLSDNHLAVLKDRYNAMNRVSVDFHQKLTNTTRVREQMHAEMKNKKYAMAIAEESLEKQINVSVTNRIDIIDAYYLKGQSNCHTIRSFS